MFSMTLRTVHPMLRLSVPGAREDFCDNSNITSSLSSLTVNTYYTETHIYMGGLVACQTHNQEVVGSSPSQVAIKWLLLGCGQVNHLGI